MGWTGTRSGPYVVHGPSFAHACSRERLDGELSQVRILPLKSLDRTRMFSQAETKSKGVMNRIPCLWLAHWGYGQGHILSVQPGQSAAGSSGDESPLVSLQGDDAD